VGSAILILLLTGIASFAQADVTNPVHEAKSKDWMTQQYPLVEMTMACNLDTKFDYLELVMKVAYSKADATGDEMQESIVNMWWGATQFDPTVRKDKAMKFAKVVKKNPDHPTIVEGCADFSKTIDGILEKAK
jgi:hypothetical protein